MLRLVSLISLDIPSTIAWAPLSAILLMLFYIKKIINYWRNKKQKKIIKILEINI